MTGKESFDADNARRDLKDRQKGVFIVDLRRGLINSKAKKKIILGTYGHFFLILSLIFEKMDKNMDFEIPMVVGKRSQK